MSQSKVPIMDPDIILDQDIAAGFGRKSGRSDHPTTVSAASGSSRSSSTRTRKATSLPNETVEYLKAWIMSPEHIAHPYPTETEKVKIMQDTGIEMKQLTNWFVNNRKRYWKPRVEAKMREEKKLQKCASQQQQVLCSLVSKEEEEESCDEEHVAAVVSPQRTLSSAGAMPKSTLFPLLSSSSSSSSTESSPPHGSMSPPVTIRTISVNNSVVSLNDLVSSDDDDDDSTQRTASCKKFKPVSFQSTENPEFRDEQQQQQQLKSAAETINVHILRSTDGSSPQLCDVTILSNVPHERILRTFENCAVNYSTSTCRDAEIVRIKKHYLAVYLTEMAAMAMASDYHHSNNIKKRPAVSVHVVTPDAPEEPVNMPEEQQHPRRKYRRQSVELWKEACQTALHVYDQNLPSLEEAAQLFGYSSAFP